MFDDVKTYAPDEVYLTFGGYIVEGWTSISVASSSPRYKTIKGIRGKNTRVKDPNSHSTITVTCHQTSMTNQVLSSIISLDENTEGVRLEVSLMDSSGFEVFSSDEAFVQKQADRQYTDDITDRSWTIECLVSRWADGKRETGIGSVLSTVSSWF